MDQSRGEFIEKIHH